jgi:hypothetical protein
MISRHIVFTICVCELYCFGHRIMWISRRDWSQLWIYKYSIVIGVYSMTLHIYWFFSLPCSYCPQHAVYQHEFTWTAAGLEGERRWPLQRIVAGHHMLWILSHCNVSFTQSTVIASLLSFLLCAYCLMHSLCNGYPISKLPGLGLSGTLAYNMNTMDSLVELWVSFLSLSYSPILYLEFYLLLISLLQIHCRDMSQNNLGGGQQIPYNLPNKKLERL